MIDLSNNQLIKITKVALSIVKESIPLYSSKNSPKIYTQHQLIVLLILKTVLKARYRIFESIISVMTPILEILSLNRVPHYTTLQKFFKRVSPHVFDRVMENINNNCILNEIIIVADGTGHSSGNASKYYSKKDKGNKKKRKSFTKNQIASNYNTQLILTQSTYKGPRHDTKDIISLLKKVKKYNPKLVCLDKAYDAEFIHEYIQLELKATSMIPLKKRAKNGKFRLGMATLFNNILYHKRNIAETIFSVIKRLFSEKVYSKTQRLRNKEVKLKNVTYNIYRTVKIGLV